MAVNFLGGFAGTNTQNSYELATKVFEEEKIAEKKASNRSALITITSVAAAVILSGAAAYAYSSNLLSSETLPSSNAPNAFRPQNKPAQFGAIHNLTSKSFNLIAGGFKGIGSSLAGFSKHFVEGIRMVNQARDY